MTVCVAAGSSEATIADIVRLYSATLKDRGYRVPVVQAYTRAVEHLLDWAGRLASHR